jgi:hypothetical protein
LTSIERRTGAGLIVLFGPIRAELSAILKSPPM